jgi:sodium/proline symporter
MAGAILIGLSGVAYVQANPGGEIADAETMFMILVHALFQPVIASLLTAPAWAELREGFERFEAKL